MITRVSVFRLVLVSLLTAFVVWGCCDADLNIGPGAGSTTCPYSALGCSLQPNPVPTSHLDIYVNSPDLATTLNIIDLIIGVPYGSVITSEPSASSLPQLDKVVVYSSYPGSPSSTWDPANFSPTACGILNSTTNTDPYSCIGYTGNSEGNSFSNWQKADPGAASFALYYYDIHNASDIGKHGLYDIFLTGNLPLGTIEVAYGCATGSPCSGDCYVTPWSNAGQVVPEPSSLLLVGGAALALFGARFRRKKG